MDDIIDRIYEASVIPELWTDILDRLAAVAQCDGGILIATDPQQTHRAVSSDCYSSMLKAYIGEGWICQNIRGARVAPHGLSGFIVDLDMVTPEEAETDALYVECLRKHGGGAGTVTVILAPSGDLIIFSLERSYKKGFVDRAVLPALDALRPHLARSALLSLRLGLERARAMTETLGRLDLPGAVLSASGRVLASNALLDNMHEQFIPIAGGGLAIAHRPGNDLFRKAIIGLPQASDGVQSHSIPIPATENSAACVAHLLPLRRQARDIFTGATSILVVTPVSSPTAPPSHILFGLFDLSPAEARVAQKIVQGSSVEEIASDHKISRETVRNQLKAIFAKTGTSRQAELVGLVMGTQIRPHGSS